MSTARRSAVADASELFGHEKEPSPERCSGAGRFELADRGTLFLDEVGELPAETQVTLLRVLQEHEFERIGGNTPIRADVRVIAATNRDVQAAIGDGSFRSDLFYRLNVFPLEVPALRQRRDDIPLLVEHFIHHYARQTGKTIRSVSRKTMELLRSHAWPGNIRELQNVIERSVIVCETDTFSVDERWLTRAAGGLTGQASPTRWRREKRRSSRPPWRDPGPGLRAVSAAAMLGVPPSTLDSRSITENPQGSFQGLAQ